MFLNIIMQISQSSLFIIISQNYSANLIIKP